MAFHGAIFDVDGVLVDSPHEQAWRQSLEQLMNSDWRDIRDLTSWSAERFTTAVYQQVVAGLPRMAGARAALTYFDVPDVDRRVEQYAAEKQRQVVALIEAGRFVAFPDALRFILAVKGIGIPVAAASSSKNANLFLRKIRLDTFAAEQRLDYAFIAPGFTLLDLFDANISGRDFPRGKPDPTIFLTAAEELGVRAEGCFVVEDAASGIQAAKSARMAGLGVARLNDQALLAEADADLVVTTLDDVSLEAVASGALRERRAAADRRQRRTERPASVWSLTYDGFDPEQQGVRETLCALGNGYFVTRGALPEAVDDGVNYPGTYVAGLYNRLTTEVAGHTVENEDLVNVPNWLSLTFRVDDGPWFDLRDADVLDHQLELDMRRATLTRHLRWQDRTGRRTSLVQRRLVSMKDPHLAGVESTFTAENWSGTVQVRSGLDGRVANAGVKRYRDLNGRHLTVLRADDADAETIRLQAETTQSRIRIAQAARTRVLADRAPVAADRRLVTEPGYVAHELDLDLQQGTPVVVEKVVALFTSRDRAISESLLAAAEAVRQAPGFDDLLARHALVWQSQWSRFEMTVHAADEWITTALHLHVLHLLQTVSQNSGHLDVGVPARGWHGEAYRGHIFWDELFIFPFLDFQRPELARAMLDYRHARIGAAREAARRSGHRGAMFPWQSGSDGREETQRIHLNPRSGRWLPDHTRLQRHVNIAIAYNVWQHFLVTGSTRFLRTVGAELVLEIARYLSSIATYDAELDRYEILGVMGPDEYHDAYPDGDRPGLDNNTYTNVMTVWVLLRALEILDVLPLHYRQEVVEELRIGEDELHRWRDITAKMRVVFHGDGVLSQFEGYEQLPEFDWQGYRAKYGDIQRLDRLLEAEGDTANRYKVAKQADTLMLLFLLSGGELRDLLRGLGYDVSADQITRTVRYYLERTSHGSTLSGVVTAWVFARHDPELAWPFVLDALESDIADAQGGTTAEGIHLGAMAGTIDILQRGLSGMRPRGEVLRFDPALPTAVKRLGFSVHYRDHRIDVDVTHDSLRVSSRPGTGSPITILARAAEAELRPGEQLEFDL